METEIVGYYRPCIIKCDPYDLIYDPNTYNCVYPDEAPPGMCNDSMGFTSDSPVTPTSTMPFITMDPEACGYIGQTFPYPSDCHLYYICLPDETGDYDVSIFDCGDLVFDPSTSTCVNEAENLCES